MFHFLLLLFVFGNTHDICFWNSSSPSKLDCFPVFRECKEFKMPYLTMLTNYFFIAYRKVVRIYVIFDCSPWNPNQVKTVPCFAGGLLSSGMRQTQFIRWIRCLMQILGAAKWDAARLSSLHSLMACCHHSTTSP